MDELICRVDPEFERRQTSLWAAAQSVCNIGVLRHDRRESTYASGTAFFVGPTTLLTAGHVVNDPKDVIWIESPGTLKATYFVENLFQRPQAGMVPRYDCKLVATLASSKAGFKADMSVLQIVGTFRSEHYLTVKQEQIDDDSHQSIPIDIIGYPGAYTDKQIQRMHPVEDLVGDELISDVQQLFPKRQLIVTHGMLVSGGKHPAYNVSTVGGMSGAPVLLNGHVIGIILASIILTIVGIHVGVEKYSRCNSCVSFDWSLIWNLLRDCGVTRMSAVNDIDRV